VNFDRAGGTDYARGGSKGADLKAEGVMSEFADNGARALAGAAMLATLGRIEGGIRIVKP